MKLLCKWQGLQVQKIRKQFNEAKNKFPSDKIGVKCQAKNLYSEQKNDVFRAINA